MVEAIEQARRDFDMEKINDALTGRPLAMLAPGAAVEQNDRIISRR